MWQSTFLPTDRITDIFFASQLLQSVSKLGQHYSKINFCDIPATVFLQSYLIMPAGRLPETESKRIYQISSPKSGRGRLRNLGSGRLRESFETVFDWETKRLFVKWSLTGGGRLREVVAIWSESWLYICPLILLRFYWRKESRENKVRRIELSFPTPWLTKKAQLHLGSRQIHLGGGPT